MILVGNIIRASVRFWTSGYWFYLMLSGVAVSGQVLDALSPVVSLESDGGDAFLNLTWHGDVGSTYQVQDSVDLHSWNIHDESLHGANDAILLTIPLEINQSSMFCRILISPIVGYFVEIPAGTFTMGDEVDNYYLDGPLHEVSLVSFYISNTEVTNEQIREVMQWAYDQGLVTITDSESGHLVRNSQGDIRVLFAPLTPNHQINWTNEAFVVHEGKANFPCNSITWYGAVAYCNFLSVKESLSSCYDMSDWSCDISADGYRLPNEAEWEYAARGGIEGQRFYWGNTITHDQANYYSTGDYFFDVSPTHMYHPDWMSDSGFYTSPVGTFLANGYGLYDMAGNVSEWCHDWYDLSYYAVSPIQNPMGPDNPSLDLRVTRGGSCSNNGDSCRMAARNFLHPFLASGSTGLRPVRTVSGNNLRASIPQISPDGGAYTQGVTVSLVTDSIGDSIYYTLDGTDPDVNSFHYSGPFVIYESSTLKAIAIGQSTFPSYVATAVFSISHPAPAGFVYIPAGAFIMGDSIGEGEPNELPIHNVNISPFYISRTEVSKSQWDNVAGWASIHGYDINSADGNGEGSNHPVQSVSWLEAVKYCNALSEKEGLNPCYKTGYSVFKIGEITPACDFSANGYRLPTEAEWELVAHGGVEGQRFIFGSTITHNNANYYSDASISYDVSATREFHPDWYQGLWHYIYTSPVGTFPMQGLGVHDMVGNVWEWCNDWYNGDYYNSSPSDNPRGPASGVSKIYRGGCYANSAYFGRSTYRGSQYPTSHSGSIGFRPVRSSIP